MKVTTKITWNLETGEVTEHDFYLYDGPVELFCSSGSKAVEANDLKLQNSQIAMNAQLSADYGEAFANNQSVLGQQRARLSAIAANPMGFDPRQLALAKTSINESTSRAASSAIGATARYGASHGAADVGGGGTGAMVGQIASEAAQSKAQQLSTLSASNEELKQQNMWKALGGLQDVGAGYGTAGGVALKGEGVAANSATSAGSGAVSAELAHTQELAGVIGSIGAGISSLPGMVTGITGLLHPGSSSGGNF